MCIDSFVYFFSETGLARLFDVEEIAEECVTNVGINSTDYHLSYI